MYERPADFTDHELADVVREHWQLAIADLRYSPVGYGGYHWAAADTAGARWFLTASPLADAGEFADLSATMSIARQLADRGLDFVVAPQPAITGEVVVRASTGYSVTVFPFADGTPGHFGDEMSAGHRATVIGMLAALHTASPDAGPAPVRPLSPLSRGALESALRERGDVWRGGPYAEAARALVSDYAGGLQDALAAFDDLAAQVTASGSVPVITHGEPHPGNLIRGGPGYLLVDWDTAGLAPPERDLWWLLSGGGAEAEAYAELTGRAVNQAAIALYRLRWDLDDACLFLADFRAPHEQNKDTEVGWAGLCRAVQDLATGRSPFSL